MRVITVRTIEKAVLTTAVLALSVLRGGVRDKTMPLQMQLLNGRSIIIVVVGKLKFLLYVMWNLLLCQLCYEIMLRNVIPIIVVCVKVCALIGGSRSTAVAVRAVVSMNISLSGVVMFMLLLLWLVAMRR